MPLVRAGGHSGRPRLAGRDVVVWRALLQKAEDDIQATAEGCGYGGD
jgi:hypothetical protein